MFITNLIYLTTIVIHYSTMYFQFEPRTYKMTTNLFTVFQQILLDRFKESNSIERFVVFPIRSAILFPCRHVGLLFQAKQKCIWCIYAEQSVPYIQTYMVLKNLFSSWKKSLILRGHLFLTFSWNLLVLSINFLNKKE